MTRADIEKLYSELEEERAPQNSLKQFKSDEEQKIIKKFVRHFRIDNGKGVLSYKRIQKIIEEKWGYLFPVRTLTNWGNEGE